MSAGGWQPAGNTLAETQQAAHLGLNTPHRDVDGVDGAHILVSADVHVHQLLPFDLNKFGDNLQLMERVTCWRTQGVVMLLLSSLLLRARTANVETPENDLHFRWV